MSDGANKMQIEQRWFIPPTVLFRAKKLEIKTKSTSKKQENLRNRRVRIRLNIDVRKEKDRRLMAECNKTKVAFVKGRLNFSSKNTTAANVHLMEPVLDNRLKKINNITVDIYMLFAGWEVRMVKNCDRGLENATRGRRPRAAFSGPRSQFFTIRTDPKPANNMFIFFLH